MGSNAANSVNLDSDAAVNAAGAPVMRASDLLGLGRPSSIEGPSELATLLPAGLPLGSLIAIRGREGSGTTTLCYRFLASGTATGAHVALLDLEQRAVPLAIAEAGVDLSRFFLVRPERREPQERLPAVVGALLDGFSVVGVIDPASAGASLWRRAAGRARERKALLVMAGEELPALDAASFVLSLDLPEWRFDEGGLLASRTVEVSITGRGAPRSARVDLTPSLPGQEGMPVLSWRQREASVL